ncbi:MAG: hypothetical protein C4570_06565 [Ammonifex sp.]|nr:MAG: hypothetical protein C4570_06565 [Ammonifex sp.]
MGQAWQDQEKQILARYYKQHGPQATCKALKRAGFNRTVSQARSMASRLDIKYEPPHPAKVPLKLDGSMSACFYCSRATALLCDWIAKGDKSSLVEYTERTAPVADVPRALEAGRPTTMILTKVIRCRLFEYGDPPPIGELQQKIS